MSLAPPYNPTASFANDETNQVAGRSTVRTVAVDTELANISTTVNALKSNLEKLQRDDDKLRDFLVEPYALAEQTRALIAAGGHPRGLWAAGQVYAVGDVVQQMGFAYQCYTAHTATAPFTANGFWISISGDGSAATNAAAAAASEASATASAAAAAASVTSAGVSATAAAGSATTAGTSATAAGNSATAAAASASAAAVSVGQAAISETNADASADAAALSAAAAAASAALISLPLSVANGGTGQTTALAAFGALKQAASTTATGVVELATNAEVQAGTDTDRAITAANLKAAQIQLGTAVSLTSQTSVDFTGIPSWAKRVKVMFSGVSTNGSNGILIQIGSGSVAASGYVSTATRAAGVSIQTTTSNSGLIVNVANANNAVHGCYTIDLVSGFTYVEAGNGSDATNAANYLSAGGITLAGLMDRVRITTVGGTDQFDGGTVNISYE